MPPVGERCFRREDDFPCRVVDVSGGTVTLKTSAGGTDSCAAADYDRLYRKDPVVHEYAHAKGKVCLGEGWTKRTTGELFAVTKIDPPPFDRVVLIGEKGQVTGCSPIRELFDGYERRK